eukprot:scaffold55555_cov18-Tisochrysis_lutea.AAC.3
MCKHPRNLKWTMQPAHASTRLTAFWQITALPHASPSLSRTPISAALPSQQSYRHLKSALTMSFLILARASGNREGLRLGRGEHARAVILGCCIVEARGGGGLGGWARLQGSLELGGGRRGAAAPGAIGGATGGRATPPAVVVCRLEGRVGGGRGGGGAARGGRSVLALGSLPVRGAVVGVDDVDADGAAASRGGGGDLLLGAGAAVAAAGSFRGRTA